MKTSKEWWQSVKADDALLVDWLAKQYHGEMTAHDRILHFISAFMPAGSQWERTLRIIAEQELQHAQWVGELLTARGLLPQKLGKPERYWDETLPGIESFESGAAVAAHAEQMRLERITAIAEDLSAPADIRAVFQRILPEERFHARAFSAMAGEDALAATLDRHLHGTKVIGLIPTA